MEKDERRDCKNAVSVTIVYRLVSVSGNESGEWEKDRPEVLLRGGRISIRLMWLQYTTDHTSVYDSCSLDMGLSLPNLLFFIFYGCAETCFGMIF